MNGIGEARYGGSVDGLLQSGTSGGVEDVAFAVMALQIQTLDAQINERIQGAYQRLEIKNAINQRLDELRQYERNATEDDDACDVEDATRYLFTIDPETGDVVKTPDPSEPYMDGTQAHWSVDATGVSQADYPESHRGGLPVGQFTGNGEPPADMVEWARANGREIRQWDGEDHGRMQKEKIDKEIDRLTGMLDELNGNSDLEMMEISRLTSQRAILFESTSNILKKGDESLGTIVGNIR